METYRLRSYSEDLMKTSQIPVNQEDPGCQSCVFLWLNAICIYPDYNFFQMRTMLLLYGNLFWKFLLILLPELKVYQPITSCYKIIRIECLPQHWFSSVWREWNLMNSNSSNSGLTRLYILQVLNPIHPIVVEIQCFNVRFLMLKIQNAKQGCTWSLHKKWVWNKFWNFVLCVLESRKWWMALWKRWT